MMRGGAGAAGEAGSLRVGILALQGAVEPHLEAFRRLGVECSRVRCRDSLARVSHLVLPGGESTTIAYLLELFGLREELLDRVQRRSLALFGVCAGAILLGHSPADEREDLPRLGCLDAVLRRNAWGGQRESSCRTLHTAGRSKATAAVLIRAPRIESWGADVRVLSRFDDGEPAALESPGLLATTFHPELGTDDWFHARFLAQNPRRCPAQRSNSADNAGRMGPLSGKPAMDPR